MKPLIILGFRSYIRFRRGLSRDNTGESGSVSEDIQKAKIQSR